MKNLYKIGFATAFVLLLIFSANSIMSFPQAGVVGCNNCHGQNDHKYEEGIIEVTNTDVQTFEVTVNDLNKDKKYSFGAQLVNMEGNIIKTVNYTKDLPITLTAPGEGDYLIYVGGRFNEFGFVYDSAFVNTEPSDVQDVTGAEDNIRISPNPASEYLSVNMAGAHYSISIYDVSGNKIMDREDLFGEENLDITNLLSGIYYINFKNNYGKIYFRKFIVE